MIFFVLVTSFYYQRYLFREAYDAMKEILGTAQKGNDEYEKECFGGGRRSLSDVVVYAVCFYSTLSRKWIRSTNRVHSLIFHRPVGRAVMRSSVEREV